MREKLGGDPQLRELFSLLVLPSRSGRDGRDGHPLLAEAGPGGPAERLLRLTGVRHEGQTLSAQATAGFFKQQRPACWNDHAYPLPYHPSSELDRQVYLKSGQLRVLTNRRLVLVAQLRPIDKLYGIVELISEINQNQPGRFDDFMDFALTNGMEETCAMLVQILSDVKATYQISRPAERILRFKRAVVGREAQHFGAANASTSRFGASSMRSNGPASLTRRQGGMPSQAHQFSSANRSFVPGRASRTQQSMSLPRQGHRFDVHHPEEEDANRGLNCFDPSDGSFVYSRPSQPKARTVAY